MMPRDRRYNPRSAYAARRPAFDAESAICASIMTLAVIAGFILVFFVTMPPCKAEDDTNCYWDATSMGNGRGVSSMRVGDLDIPYTPEGE